MSDNPSHSNHAVTQVPTAPETERERPAVYVRALPERDRRRMLRHFLALSPEDRLLRFGSTLNDELVTRYVEHIDFKKDTVFGVFDQKLKLVGVGHLAFAPKESRSSALDVTVKERIAEFGLSVSASARGMGVGSRLFQRAAIHCRNADVDTLYMHCLSSNQTMIRIARKAGMEIQRDHGEADAYLKLLPASPSSVMQEALEEQVALIDYTFKANTRAAAKFLNALVNPQRSK